MCSNCNSIKGNTNYNGKNEFLIESINKIIENEDLIASFKINEIAINLRKSRYKQFKLDCTCSQCGLKGDIYKIRKNKKKFGLELFNQNNKFYSLKIDSKLPKTLDNLRTICSNCKNLLETKENK